MQTAPHDLKTELKESDMKSTLHTTVRGPQVPNFHPFRSTISRFQDIAHLRIPIDSHVKISKYHKFKFLADQQNIYNFTFPYDYLIYDKVWLRSDKNCRRSSVLKRPAPYGPVHVNKNFKVP